ncbi:MAG: hypothetical protein JWN16_1610 [Alphaproteobacteria bacterium]|nr:hypothetical protein [Alphaproteobacteria bacterium]
MAAPQKLSHLLQLADQGPVMRAALAEEVAELLVNWPSDYPQSMRGVCEALLAKAARDVDSATRARLRVQLFSDPELTARVLPRECATLMLVDAARKGDNDGVVKSLAQAIGVDDAMARQVLDDESGAALAVACKGSGLDRAAFSALALMAHPGRDRAHAYAVLDAFDNVPTSEATRVLRGWRENQRAA